MNVRRYPRPAVAVAFPAFLCLGLALWLAFGWGGDAVVIVVESVAPVAFAIYATVCSVLAARSAHGRNRAAWTVMSVALATFTVAGLTAAFYSLVVHRVSSPSPADAMYWAASALTVAAILQLPAGLAARSRTRLFLDCLVVAVALFVLLLATGAESLYQSTIRDIAAGMALAHVYPALDLFVAMVAVLALAHAGAGQRGPLWLISAAFVIRELADIALSYQIATGRFGAWFVVDIGWAVSLILLGAAALVARGARSTARSTDLVTSPSVSVLAGGN